MKKHEINHKFINDDDYYVYDDGGGDGCAYHLSSDSNHANSLSDLNSAHDCDYALSWKRDNCLMMVVVDSMRWEPPVVSFHMYS